MALKDCPECKEKVSKSAASCPNCGASIKWRANGLAIVLFIGFIALWFAR